MITTIARHDYFLIRNFYDKECLNFSRAEKGDRPFFKVTSFPFRLTEQP